MLQLLGGRKRSQDDDTVAIQFGVDECSAAIVKGGKVEVVGDAVPAFVTFLRDGTHMVGLKVRAPLTFITSILLCREK